MPQKMVFVLICHKNGWVVLPTKMVWVVLPKPCGVGWGWAGAGAIGVISQFSRSSIKYIRRERIEDFVCSVEL